MANYFFPPGTFHLEGVTSGEATYSFITEYAPPFNWSFINLTVVTSCGGHMYIRLPYEVGASGDANTDHVVMSQIQTNVDNYMASLEI